MCSTSGPATRPTRPITTPTSATVLRNAVRWAHNPAKRVADVNDAPNVPVDSALEPITERGPRLHHDGEEGLR